MDTRTFKAEIEVTVHPGDFDLPNELTLEQFIHDAFHEVALDLVEQTEEVSVSVNEV